MVRSIAMMEINNARPILPSSRTFMMTIPIISTLLLSLCTIPPLVKAQGQTDNNLILDQVKKSGYDHVWESDDGWFVSRGYTFPNVESVGECAAICASDDGGRSPGGSYGYANDETTCYCDQSTSCVEPYIVQKGASVFSRGERPRECRYEESYCVAFDDMATRDWCDKQEFDRAPPMPTDADTTDEADDDLQEDLDQVNTFGYGHVWHSVEGWFVSRGWMFSDVDTVRECAKRCRDEGALGGSFGYTGKERICYCDQRVDCVEPVIVQRGARVFSTVPRPRTCRVFEEDFCTVFADDVSEWCSLPTLERNEVSPATPEEVDEAAGGGEEEQAAATTTPSSPNATEEDEKAKEEEKVGVVVVEEDANEEEEGAESTAVAELAPSQTFSAVYDAEDYTKKRKSTVENDLDGYTGSGYLNFDLGGSYVEWDNVMVHKAGEYSLVIRYANGDEDDRECLLYLQGSTDEEVATLPFAYTGSWQTWANETVVVSLREGANAVKIKSVWAGPNIDRMVVESRDVTVVHVPWSGADGDGGASGAPTTQTFLVSGGHSSSSAPNFSPTGATAPAASPVLPGPSTPSANGDGDGEVVVVASVPQQTTDEEESAGGILVRITSPVDDGVLRLRPTDTITVGVIASYPDGSIIRVELRRDGTLVGTDYMAPYEFQFEPPPPPDGDGDGAAEASATHLLEVRAYNDRGEWEVQTMSIEVASSSSQSVISGRTGEEAGTNAFANVRSRSHLAAALHHLVAGCAIVAAGALLVADAMTM